MEPTFDLEIGTRALSQLPNFRTVQLSSNEQQQQQQKHQLYRSGYVDRLSEAGVRELSEHVACIVDLRGRRELLRTLRGSHVTSVYRQRVLNKDGSVQCVPEAPDTQTSRSDRVRYTIDFLGRDFFFGEFRRLPFSSKVSIGASFITSYFTGSREYEGTAAELILKPRGLVGQACDFVDFCQREVATVLRLFLIPGNLPCLVHCFLGKDRTGLIALLMQWLMDVPVHIMRKEYLMSMELVAEVRQEAIRYYADKRLPASFSECHNEEFVAVMQHINDEYGGVHSYLLRAGLTEEELQQLKMTFGGSGSVVGESQ